MNMKQIKHYGRKYAPLILYLQYISSINTI